MCWFINDDYEQLRKALKGVNPHKIVDFDRITNILVGNAISNSD